MTWRELLGRNAVKRHKTSKEELESVREIIARDLADASVAEVSADRRFATAYNAALQSAKMAIACAGYRVTTGAGHHKISFESVPLAIGASANSFADYFDRGRRKRNTIDYDGAFVATETEAQEILLKAKEFADTVEQWIAAKHPVFQR